MARRLRFSKNDRVLGLIALMAASSFGVGGIVAFVTAGEASSILQAKVQLATAEHTARDLATEIEQELAYLDDYVLSRSPVMLTRFNDTIAQESETVRKVMDVTADLPDVRSALQALEATSIDWRGRVAVPAIAAIRIGDEASLARFATQAGQDHVAITDGTGRVDRWLTRLEQDVAERQSSAAVTANLGIAIAFGVLVIAFGVALLVVRRFGRALEQDAQQSNLLNQFTEVTSFAADDRHVAEANLIALGRLASPDASVTHLLNRSLDRAVPEAQTGDAVADVLPLRALDRCAGVLRGTMYVSDDLSDNLSVHCPIYPATNGTLACVPLGNDEMVGAVHLYWRRPNALPLDRRSSISRVTEHAALAIGNRRLLAALHGQANTDPRTGLANSRAFDLALEGALVARAGHEPIAVLMIDVDRFKQFNDRHGHPAGDEALRAFAGVLRSCMRDGDVAARYGGEEFAVLLPGVDSGVAAMIAERIRQRTETTIIALAPGITDHITVSIGISHAPEQGLDRVTLLRLADEALYRAKEGGRNRVVGLGELAAPQRALAATADAAVTPPPTRTRRAS